MPYAVILDRFGEPTEVLRHEQVDQPVPNAGQVLVEMLAAPINPSDLMMVRGKYGVLPQLPCTPGFEGVGRVLSAGKGILGRLWVGKRVAMLSREAGTWRTHAVAPANQVLPLPSAIPDHQGAMFFVNPLTAFVLTQRVLRLRRGEWLLQSAAGSAVGRMIIRLGKRFGFSTLNLVRRPEQAQELLELGADAVLAFHDGMVLRDEVKRATGGAAVVAALDPVGGATASQMLDSLALHGRLVIYGSLADTPFAVDARRMLTMGTTVEGFWLAHYMGKLGLVGRLALIRQVARLVADGTLTSPIAGTFPLSQIHAAVATAESVGKGGKVLLTM